MIKEWLQGLYFRGSYTERNKDGVDLTVVPKYSVNRGIEVWNWYYQIRGEADTEEAAQKAAERAADAYRRGAEAMREQAAQRITCHFPDATADGSRCGLCHFCEAGWDQHIRALPIPEDKE